MSQTQLHIRDDDTTSVLEEKRYVQVLVDLDAKILDRRTFTYSVPEELQDILDIGVPVKVPFGHIRQLTGYVVGFSQYVAQNIKTKPIVDVLDDTPLFDLSYLQFLDWVANYTVTPLMTVLTTALPPSLLKKSKRKVLLNPEITKKELNALPEPEKQIALFLFGKKQAVSSQYLTQRLKLPVSKLNSALAKLQKINYLSSERVEHKSLQDKTEKIVSLTPGTNLEKLTKRQKQVYQTLFGLLKPQPCLSLKQCVDVCKTTTKTLEQLQALGVITIEEQAVNRDRKLLSTYQSEQKSLKKHALNPAQQAAFEAVLMGSPAEEFLLYGVTGSGKTEVYLALTEQALKNNQSVLILLPEITLTSHIARRFIQAFGKDQVVLWHSQLSQGEKVDAWRRIKSGELKIVIGARSAIFTPMNNLAYIIIDEAHEGSFKQETPAPRYHAVTLAKYLARTCAAKLVMGSATPDVAHYYEAEQAGRVLLLPDRFASRPLAEVTLVDMAKNKQQGHTQTLSYQLMEKLKTILDKKQQAIILLNRRGFNTFIQCQTCQTVYECPHCAVSMTYHSSRGHIQCHYCGFEAEKPQFCRQCAARDLAFMGTGTQRLEQELEVALPHARVARIDGDVMSSKNQYRDILDGFREQQIDILLGTQMIAKGLDIANVTLVGVVGADMILNMPDYRAYERGFQLLTQVAGRAGRGELEGEVYIQSWQVDHPVFEHVLKQNFMGFYHDEIIRRQTYELPPFGQLFRIIVSSPDEFKAKHFLEALALNWQVAVAEQPFADAVKLWGPAPCLIARIQGRYRYHLLIKNLADESVHQFIAQFYRNIQPPTDIQCILDVDALSLF